MARLNLNSSQPMVTIKIGWDQWLLPLDASAEVMRCLSNAVKVESDYDTGLMHGYETPDITLQLVDTKYVAVYEPEERERFKEYLEAMKAEKRIAGANNQTWKRKDFRDLLDLISTE